MGLFSNTFGFASPEEQKNKKFQEFEAMFGGDEEMINNSKATWLTSRGNHSGERNKFDEATTDFEEAIRLKKDHLPAHLGLAIAWERKGEHDKAMEILNSAPEQMKLHGEVIANKKDMMSGMM